MHNRYIGFFIIIIFFFDKIKRPTSAGQPSNPALPTTSQPIDLAKIEDTLKMTQDLLDSKPVVPEEITSDWNNEGNIADNVDIPAVGDPVITDMTFTELAGGL